MGKPKTPIPKTKPTNSKQIMTEFIRSNTTDCISVVEFGCMFGDRFKLVAPTVKNRVGIEIWEPYLKEPNFSFTPILGDMRMFKSLVDNKYFECAMLIDSIEHIPKDDGIALLKEIQTCFSKIILITPLGIFDQNKDLYGYGADEHQTHKSYWYENDLKELEFETIIHRNYVNPLDEKNSKDGLYGIWKK